MDVIQEYHLIKQSGDRGRLRQADSRRSSGKLLRGRERRMPASNEKTVKCQINITDTPTHAHTHRLTDIGGMHTYITVILA